VKAIIVQEELKYLINAHSRIQLEGCFDDGLDVLKYLQHHQVDAIFLDINIPSLDGGLLAQNISKFAHRPYIIFITAYKEHAAEAFEIEAFDYILKPYHEARIVIMLQKLEAHFRHDRQAGEPPAAGGETPVAARHSHSINLTKDERIIVTDINDIYYAAWWWASPTAPPTSPPSPT